jgi:hypothetical protein
MLPSEAKQIGLIDQVASLADYRVGQQSLLMLAGQLANQKDRAGAQIPPVLSKELIVELTRRKEAELRALRVQPAQIPPTAKLPASTEPAGSSSVMPALGNFLRVPPSVPMDYYMKGRSDPSRFSHHDLNVVFPTLSQRLRGKRTRRRKRSGSSVCRVQSSRGQEWNRTPFFPIMLLHSSTCTLGFQLSFRIRIV